MPYNSKCSSEQLCQGVFICNWGRCRCPTLHYYDRHNETCCCAEWSHYSSYDDNDATGGIVAGVVVGIFAISMYVIIFYLYRRRRRAMQEALQSGQVVMARRGNTQIIILSPGYTQATQGNSQTGPEHIPGLPIHPQRGPAQRGLGCSERNTGYLPVSLSHEEQQSGEGQQYSPAGVSNSRRPVPGEFDPPPSYSEVMGLQK